ncbi:MAG: ImmA/IrrE family metallo-endopeptidase [Candidatus Thiodiazotropha taylori]
MSYTRVQIRKKVEGLLDRNGVTKPCVDVVEIADKEGVRITYEVLEDDVSGFLVVKNRQGTIAVNSTHHNNRQRFTIAHELGHYFLHSVDNGKDDLFIDKKVFHRGQSASEGTVRKEIEANRFAAELLMPRSMMKEAVKEEGGDIDLSDDVVIFNLSNLFCVSEQALTYRLTDLNIIPRLWD